jgi:DDE superfamily endonuclease
MSPATRFWSIWQDLLKPFVWAFTRLGHRRFVEWVTGLALTVEEHTLTGAITALDRPADWRALEHFAEYGAWDAGAITTILTRRVEQAPGRIWYGYHVSAVDDTKIHRNSKDVWGTCTFHEYTARCPNRAATVRAHNWVLLGAVLDNLGRPAWFLPLDGRLYFRQSQLPERPEAPGRTEPFRTKCERAVELLREQARIIRGRHLGLFDGGYALKSVVRPLVVPEDGSPRIEFLTRLRHDARLHTRPPERSHPNRKWGRKLPPPRQGGRWPGPWHEGEAVIYGRKRKVPWKEIVCLWRVVGHEVPVKAVVAKVEGYKKRFTLVTSAMELTGLQVVELFAARFRQEDGIRDLKQHLGWEECRAWTRNPIERTSQAQWVTMSLLRLVQFRLEAEGEGAWWSKPPWYPQKERPSVLDVERLLRQHRPEILQLLSAWLGEGEEAA